jgi:hypothetical protein
VRQEAVQHLRVLAHDEVGEQRDTLAYAPAGCRSLLIGTSTS